MVNPTMSPVDRLSLNYVLEEVKSERDVEIVAWVVIGIVIVFAYGWVLGRIRL